MKRITFTIITTFMLANIGTAQTNKDIITQDSKFTSILDEKRKINNAITVNDHYKIQIFHGSNEGATKTLKDFKVEYKNIDATIVFATPNYKVWVGSYKTRIEANKMLTEISKKFDRAIILKPSK